ncbi:MAG: AAA family ATPase [Acidimicrobiia bacterium]
MALLVLAPQRLVGREVLIDHLFAHLPVDRAMRNVSKALSQARAVIGSHYLQADATNIWIADDVVVESDLDAASQLLREALTTPPPPELWPELRVSLATCGDLLADDVYEEWAQTPIRALDDLVRQAWLALARASNETSDWLQTALQDAACDEAWCALLSDCGHRGDRVGLNHVFSRCRRAMLDELGIEPSTQVRELYTSLRRALAESEHITPATDMIVVGRDGELEYLVEVMQAAEEGRGGSVLVTGAAGVGKSHLLTATARRLSARGYRLAVGASGPEDSTVPFASLRSALAPMLSGPGRRGTLLGRLLDPESTTESTDRTPNPIPVLADEISAALDALGEPVLLVLDDVHWADQSLQALLVRLAAEARPRQWALLMAARSDEPGHPLPPLPSRCHVVALSPLTHEATATLARQLLSDQLAVDQAAAEALVGVLVDRSAGNPFFLSELVRAAATGTESPADILGEEVPQRVVALLRHRVSTCSPPARDALAVVALAGEVTTYDLLESVLPPVDDSGQDGHRILGGGHNRVAVPPAADGHRRCPADDPSLAA